MAKATKNLNFKIDIEMWQILSKISIDRLIPLQEVVTEILENFCKKVKDNKDKQT